MRNFIIIFAVALCLLRLRLRNMAEYQATKMIIDGQNNTAMYHNFVRGLFTLGTKE